MEFYDRSDCLNPSPYIDEYGTKSGIFVFKNIIKKDTVEKIEKELESFTKKNIRFEDTLIDWYAEKVIPSVNGMIDVWEQISEIIGPKWVLNPVDDFVMLKPEHEGMFIHTDSPGKNAHHLLSQIDAWSCCCLFDYGLVSYFGDFEGGEIFYPNINKDGTVKENNKSDINDCFEYKPESGDLVIHSVFSPYSHGVRKVKSGTRYAFACFALKAEDNPGTFYNYGTKEYYEQIGNKTPEEIIRWNTPLKQNTQFTEEIVKEMKNSGLQGKDLSDKFFSDFKIGG